MHGENRLTRFYFQKGKVGLTILSSLIFCNISEWWWLVACFSPEIFRLVVSAEKGSSNTHSHLNPQKFSLFSVKTTWRSCVGVRVVKEGHTIHSSNRVGGGNFVNFCPLPYSVKKAAGAACSFVVIVQWATVNQHHSSRPQRLQGPNSGEFSKEEKSFCEQQY